MHLFWEINMVQLIDWQTAGVWDNDQSGSAKHCWPCVQVRWHIVLERVLRWCFLQQKNTLSFPNGGIETLPWPGARSFQKENAQITALWECFNPLALHLLNFAVVVSSPRFVQTSSQSVSPFQFEKRPLPHWLAMFVAPLTEPPNRWATSEMPMANGWRVIHIWLPY